MKNDIVFIDTNSIGNFHEIFNTAFFKILEKNYDSITYISSDSCIEAITKILNDKALSYDQSKIHFKKIKVLKGSQSYHIFLRKLLASFLLFFLLIKNRKEKIILANLNEFSTLYLNSLVNIFDIKLGIITHGELEYMIQDVPKNKPIFLYKSLLKHFFKNKISENIQILTLGKSIEDNLKQIFPVNSKIIKSIEHPYFFDSNAVSESSDSNIIRMGIVGTVGENKGMSDFIKLSQHLESSIHQGVIEFHVIGKHNYNIENYPLLRFLAKPNTSIPTKEYNDAIQKLDFILFFYNENQYRLTASGAIFDAINHNKPIIALKNSYFNHVFSYGKVGYLCENIEEMKDIIKDVVDKKNVNFDLRIEFEKIKNIFDWKHIVLPLIIKNN
ncbi:glycosyltransferase family 1 protein [Chryseobacterium sp. G0162]|uniref:glycosyltransferase n=1 Tax=Chryseobacterium sp. G0162 TaxID=2487063 RepID=UPI000F4F9F01|nr:glycosyltransferase [Chryseobacterium sp. G0162]AZB10284.1 glycosyltransferase family 1 protein [Chryseobacterium sp. G0162]